MVQSLSAAGLWRTRSCLRAWMRRSGRQSSLLWVRSSWWSACGASTLRVWSTTTRWKSAATATRGKHQQTITAIGRSSVGKGARASGRVPFFFGFFWNRPAGGVKARGRCGNGDSGRLSHPSNSLRVGLGTLRPLKARKSLLLGGNGGQTCRGFQHSDRLRVSLGTLRPSEC